MFCLLVFSIKLLLTLPFCFYNRATLHQDLICSPQHPIVLVLLGSYNETKWMSYQQHHLLLTVLEAEILRSGCQHGWVKTSFLVHSQGLLIVFSYGGRCLSGPSFIPLWLKYLPRPHPVKPSSLRFRTITVSLGGTKTFRPQHSQVRKHHVEPLSYDCFSPGHRGEMWMELGKEPTLPWVISMLHYWALWGSRSSQSSRLPLQHKTLPLYEWAGAEVTGRNW